VSGAGATATSRRPGRPALAAVATLIVATAATAGPARSCSTVDAGWCVARRVVSEVPRGELGFRFGTPRDVDGDGVADVAAGARFALRGVHQDGMAAVWSGASGSRLRAWAGELRDGLFGHAALPLPDLDGDRRADVVISAPNAVIDGAPRGVVVARSPHTGGQIWRRQGAAEQNFGWDLDLGDDHDGDGRRDVVVGAPGRDAGRAYLLSGADGRTLRSFAPRRDEPSFGWYVAATGDLDGDGRSDVVVGAHLTKRSDGAAAGAAYLFSSTSGEILRQWQGAQDRSGFGEVVAAIGDLDGDGRGEVAVAAPRTNERTRHHPGEVFVYSGASGAVIRHFTGKQPGELFGRMVAAAGDVDGDGTEDIAIGAPWHRSAAGERAGRLEIRSGRGGEVLADLAGDTADAWFGWHIVRAPDPEGKNRPAFLVSSLRHPVNDVAGTGVIDWYVLR
jgi:hypothetical protein